MHERSALFMGRFQPPSVAHWHTAGMILREWPRLTIAVVYDTQKPAGWDEQYPAFRELAESPSWRQDKNPFSAEEVKRLWDACIASQQMTSCVRVVEIPRPEFGPDLFNATFPSEHFDLVRPTPTPGDEPIDGTRGRLFPELFRRSVREVRPEFKLHNSAIRELLQKGVGTWEEYLAPGTAATFRELNGPARIMRHLKAA